MKQFSILMLGLALLAGSCKKSDDNGNGAIAGGSFTINGQSYAVTSAARINSGNLISFMFSNFNAQTLANSHVTFYFPGAATPAAGTYTVVGSTAGMSANQVSFSASSSDGSMNTTFYEPAGGESVNVTVNGDKVTINMASATASSSAGGNVTISAAVGEK